MANKTNFCLTTQKSLRKKCGSSQQRQKAAAGI